MKKFQEGKILLAVEGCNLVVSVFGVIKPYLSYFGLSLGERIR